MTIAYFAYGSNMLSTRLGHPSRAPSARLVAAAVAHGHGLRFHKLGQDGSGKCDAFAAPSEALHGVVFEVVAADLERLDGVEGVGCGYQRRTITVRMRGGCTLRAETYVAQTPFIDSDLDPFVWYRDLVHCGAHRHGLPEPYVARIARRRAVIDGDRRRAQAARALLPRAAE